jgi:hypothetical protein
MGEADGVVRRLTDGLGDVDPDLAGVHVEGSCDLDVLDTIAADLHVHHARRRFVARRPGIVRQPLNQSRGAVAHADDADPHLRILFH